MRIKTYEDFDLSIERAGDRYRARVLNSPDGSTDYTNGTEFDLPFSDLDLENFILRFGQTRGSMRNIGVASETVNHSLRDFGAQLYNAVFSGPVADRLHGSLDIVGQQENAGLRIRLRLSDVPELIDVPWEYLFDASTERFLALSIDTPLVRYLEMPDPIKPLAVQPPLRILVMLCSPVNYAVLDVEQEWKKLKDAVADLESRGLVILERMEKPTLAELQRRLRKQDIHVFHFIGHGDFDETVQDGVLVMEGENGQARPTSGKNLGMILHDEKSVKLAVLNACEGGRTSRQDPFAGVGQSLVQQGIPAVVAMQFEISDQAAITLAHEFYAALADSYPVDAALAEARKAIFAQDNIVEWGTPVLYMRSEDGHLFDLVGYAPTLDTSQIPSTTLLTQFTPAAQTSVPVSVSQEPHIVGSLQLVPVSTLTGRVVMARPRLTIDGAASAIMDWVKEWGAAWPPEVTEADITEKLTLVYAPYLVITGVASARFTASVAKPKLPNEMMSTKRAGETITYTWSPYAIPIGVEINNAVTANFGTAKVGLETKGRTVDGVEIMAPFPKDMLIIKPEMTTKEAFQAFAQRRLRDRLQNEFNTTRSKFAANSIRSASMSQPRVQQASTYSWLLPVYAGVFGAVELQVDADTGAATASRHGNSQEQTAESSALNIVIAQAQAADASKRRQQIQAYYIILALLGIVLVIVVIVLSSR